MLGIICWLGLAQNIWLLGLLFHIPLLGDAIWGERICWQHMFTCTAIRYLVPLIELPM